MTNDHIIWLHGPSGAGKTSVGRIVAERLGIPFLDLDAEVEREVGASVAQIFESQGVGAFRRMEWNTLLALLENRSGPVVLALGGGANTDPAVRQLMRECGVRVALLLDAARAIERIVADTTPRPLLTYDDPESAWRELYGRREAFYRDTDAIVDAAPAVERVADAVLAAVERLAGPLWSVQATIDGASTSVTGVGTLPLLRAALRSYAGSRRVCVIADEALAEGYDHLLHPGDQPWALVVTVRADESQKSLESVAWMARAMAAHRIGRGDLVVGIGGGVITDLAGFVASVYMRGVECVLVPTTLLAMVDAALGGKSAVNAGGVRNLLGTVRQPRSVFVAPAFLHTLPRRELRAGMVEALKMGIANDQALAAAVENAMPSVLEGTVPTALDEVIRLSINTKLDVVARDPYDQGPRLSLNLGHTFAHALEAAQPEARTHGEAVAFGLIASAEVARGRERISEERLGWITARALPLAGETIPLPPMEELLELMRADKKRSGGPVRLVLPCEGIGVTVEEIAEEAEIVAALERTVVRQREHAQQTEQHR